MKLDKLTKALLISPVGLALFLLPVFFVVSIFGFGRSIWSLLVYGLLFTLSQYSFRRLAKRWPIAFGSDAVEGGPRVTISRVFILCVSVVLCVATIVYVRLVRPLSGLQAALVGGLMFCALLLWITFLEARWRASDAAGDGN